MFRIDYPRTIHERARTRGRIGEDESTGDRGQPHCLTLADMGDLVIVVDQHYRSAIDLHDGRLIVRRIDSDGEQRIRLRASGRVAVEVVENLFARPPKIQGISECTKLPHAAAMTPTVAVDRQHEWCVILRWLILDLLGSDGSDRRRKHCQQCSPCEQASHFSHTVGYPLDQRTTYRSEISPPGQIGAKRTRPGLASLQGVDDLHEGLTEVSQKR